jgi:hypothetical protein
MKRLSAKDRDGGPIGMNLRKSSGRICAAALLLGTLSNSPALSASTESDPLLAAYVDAVPDPAICDQPETRDAFLRDMEAAGPRSSLAAEYNAKREARLERRMAAIGMTKAERGKLALAAVQHPDFQAAFTSNLGTLSAMMAAARRAGEATEATPRCQASVELRRLLAATVEGANRQWDLMDGMVTAEATKRGKPIP